MSDTPFEAPSVESIAALLPAFEFEALIAQGGMGAVYKARQKSLDRDVAIKILPRELCEDPEFRESFRAEAKAMARLSHPNLIGVFDSGEVGGLLYIVMEFVNGKSLYHSAYGKSIEPHQAADLMIGVCRGLAHAHENGVIHRDIKPANILLTPKCEPKIGDFGLARAAGPDSQGMVMGTPGYTAPEVLTHPDQTDQESDIFSIGAVLRELLTGVSPASGEPGTPITDPTLRRICDKATHEDPGSRYPDALAMAEALESWERSRSAPAAAPPQGYRPPAPKTAARSSGSPALRNVAIIAFLLGAIYLAWTGLEKKKAWVADQENKPVEPVRKVIETTEPEKETAATETPEETEESADPEAGLRSLEGLRTHLVLGRRERMPTGTVAKGGSLTFFVPTPMSWTEARRFAREFDAHLPIATSPEQLEWLAGQLPADSPESWIGALSENSQWFSVDGSAWTMASMPAGSGTFGALRADRSLTAHGGETRLPFLIEWRRDGRNPTTLESMLERTSATLDGGDPVFPLGTVRDGEHRTFTLPADKYSAEASRLAKLGGGRLVEPAEPSGRFAIAWGPEAPKEPEPGFTLPEMTEAEEAPEVDDTLTVQAEKLLRSYDETRKSALAKNAKDYHFKLDQWVSRPIRQSDVAPRQRAAALVRADKDSNRIPDGIPEEPCTLLPDDLLDITAFYLGKQRKADAAFENDATNARKFYISRLEKAAAESDAPTARVYRDRMEKAADLNSWLASIDCRPGETPKFPEFVIGSALFGPEGDEDDVTARVTELFESGRPQFPVNANTLLTEPIPGRLKTLTIEFLANGTLKSRQWSAGHLIFPANLRTELISAAE